MTHVRQWSMSAETEDHGDGSFTVFVWMHDIDTGRYYGCPATATSIAGINEAMRSAMQRIIARAGHGDPMKTD
jgi:hypothetical protein